MNESITIEPGKLGRLFGYSAVALVRSGSCIALSDSVREKESVQVNGLAQDNVLREGLLFSALNIPLAGGTITLKWLPKRVARKAASWLRAQWYQGIAPDIAATARDIRRILGSGYLRDSRLQTIQSLARESRGVFKFPPEVGDVSDEIYRDFRLICEVAEWRDDSVQRYRWRYVRHTKEKFADYFDSIESNPLTDSQRDACVIDQDNNLVLAGAGTGKTSTMIGRAGFLVKSGQSQPREILMLAFAKKAADEMQQRLSERIEEQGIVATTFHKLGKNIIASVEDAQPSVSPLAEDDKVLTAHVNQWFEEQMMRPGFKSKVLKYFEYYLYPQANPFDFETQGEYFDYIAANEIRTLKGEAVKGFGECQIANHLFKLGVGYQYEAAYEHVTRSLDFRQYQPDFYLPEYGIYVEHVGIDRNGDTAPYVDRDEYHRGMEWKRQLHLDNETTLIETYHYELNEGVLLTSLESKLENAGVIFSRLPEEAVLATLGEFGAVSALAALLAQLLRRYKTCHLDEAQEQQLIRNSEHPKQIAAALELLSPILKAYEAKLSSDEQIDFDDMIGRAISYVQQGRYRSPWRYILVDEFQDISEPRARLVKALRDSVPDSSLFCVGDDWQAIYRFTGSDIAFTADFEKEFGATKTTPLDKTFRFNNSICHVASKFVLRNPGQLKKSLSTHMQVNRPAVSLLRKSPTRAGADDDGRVIEVLDKISQQAKHGSTVYLLGRFGFNLPGTRAMRALKQRYPDLDITTLTMHGSKGKEADFVVLLGMESGKHGFPSQKITHPLLEALLPQSESFAHAEERRLFYVALTRARHRAYLICDMSSASEFIVELIKDKYPLELEEFKTSLAQLMFQAIACNKCITGTMVPRQGRHGAFFGCSHYPLCDNAENGCRTCGNPMQRLDRFKVCINPDCTSWVPTCPQCGAEMTQRDGLRGKFWGCRNYRGTESVSCAHTENEINYEPAVR